MVLSKNNAGLAMKHQVQALVKQPRKRLKEAQSQTLSCPPSARHQNNPEFFGLAVETDRSGKPYYSGMHVRYEGMGQQLKANEFL